MTIPSDHPFYSSLFLFSPAPRFQIYLSMLPSFSEWCVDVLLKLSQGWSCEAVVQNQERSLSLQMGGSGSGKADLLVCSSLSLADDGWGWEGSTLGWQWSCQSGSLLLPTTDLQKHMMAYESIWTKAFSSAHLFVVWVKEIIITTAFQIQVPGPLIQSLFLSIKYIFSTLSTFLLSIFSTYMHVP